MVERRRIIEFAIYDQVCRDRRGIGEVVVEDEDKELIDKENNV
jgi:hypothetical protein